MLLIEELKLRMFAHVIILTNTEKCQNVVRFVVDCSVIVVVVVVVVHRSPVQHTLDSVGGQQRTGKHDGNQAQILHRDWWFEVSVDYRCSSSSDSSRMRRSSS